MDQATRQQLTREKNLDHIKRKIVVMSGKGGVGKSTVAVNLACMLCEKGYAAGIVDTDIHGPSLKTMLKTCGNVQVHTGAPVKVDPGKNLFAASMSYFLDSDDSPVIWRGPMKTSMIKRFFEEMQWPSLDYMVIDTPPGTGDEQLTVLQTLGGVDFAIVVATPQDLALVDVKKAVQFLKHMGVTQIGIIENMSGFTCPHCNESISIFKSGSVAPLAAEYGITFLGSIPMDTDIVASGDNGRPYICDHKESAGAKSIATIADQLHVIIEKNKKGVIQ